MGPEGLTDRIRAIEPLLADNAALAEELHQPVDTVWEAICATGALKSFVPRHFGGYELGLQDFMEIGVTLGRGCVSTAWVTTFCMEHNWLLANPLQRIHRDVHTLAGHMVFDVDVASSNYGRAMLGFEIAGLV